VSGSSINHDYYRAATVSGATSDFRNAVIFMRLAGDCMKNRSRAVCHDNLKIHARVLASLGIEGHWPAKLAT
jgi:hypothetical protein